MQVEHIGHYQAYSIVNIHYLHQSHSNENTKVGDTKAGIQTW